MAGTHSVLAASAAPRWSRCPASPAAARNEPQRPTPEYSAKGSAKHQVAEQCLNSGRDAETFGGIAIPMEGFKFTVGTEFIIQVQSYVDAVRRLPGSKLYEVKLDTSPVLGVPGQSGTSDAVILDFDTLTITAVDAKFGFNIVYADSEQLRLYLEAAFIQFAHLADWKRGKTVISQPAIDHYDEREYTREESAAFGASLQASARKAWELFNLPPFSADAIRAAMVPGEKQCEWCPIRGKCEARTRKVLDMFEPTTAKREAAVLEDIELLSARDKVDEIQRWCSDIIAELDARARVKPMAGWKWVEGREGPRKWKDEVAAERALCLTFPPGEWEQMYKPRTIVSPTEAERLLGKATMPALADQIERSAGKQTLVRDSDSRVPTNRNVVEFEPVAGA